ncbi:MAG: vWA domain-containing protein [Planctomycetota bacterium]
MRALSLFAAGLLAVGLPLPAQTPPAPTKAATEPPPEAFGPLATAVIVRSYGETEPWSLRAVVVLSLGSDWHPDGVPIVLATLRDRDERLVPYGIEVLRGMDDASLREVATHELVDELVDKQLKRKNALFTSRVLAVLARMLPQANITDRKSAETWWRHNRDLYVVAPWTEPPKVQGAQRGATVGTSVLTRAFDLRDAGLDVVIVVDSTGSMQIAIDTARDAIDDVVALLSGIAPKLRLGLVDYKDLEDVEEGARLLAPLTKNQQDVRDKLAKLEAGGGGDFPERVDKGIEIALSKGMGWNKDANRLLLVIGDAPVHSEHETALLDVVKRAYEHPFETGKGAITGKKAELRPFVTSTIGIGPGPTDQFARMATAGGGASVTLELQAAAPPPAGGRGAAPPPPPPAAAAARTNASVQQIVEHVLALSFGPSHRAHLQRFVRTFFEYRAAGMFR